MTEPTYEINQEKLESLTIADLSSLLILNKLYPSKDKSDLKLNKVLAIELKKRINDIIVF